jgi:predicted lipid-binding transport protein (Tim44 family)
MSQPGLNPAQQRAFDLEFPQSLGTYDTYAEAQKAVDFLADREFPVENVMLVGTDLKQVERVTGRLTSGRVMLGGLLSGVWIGVFVGLVFAMFEGGEGLVPRMLSTVLIGAVFGLVWAWIGYKAAGGKRDFTSVSQVLATRYELLVEHRNAQQARELLAEHDPMRAAIERARIMREDADRAAAAEAARRPPSPPAV